MARRTLTLLILGLLSLGAVALIVHLVGLRNTVGVLREAGTPAFVAMLGLTVVWLGSGALAWDFLGRPIGHRVPFRTLFKGVLIGFVGNFVTPSMYLGGEPLRVAYVGRRRNLPYYQVAGTVLLSKYLEFMAFVLMICLGTGVALVYYWEDLWSVVRVAAAVGALVLLAVLVLLIVALRGRHRPISAVVGWLIRLRILRRWLRLRRRRIRQMEDQISRTFNREGRSAWCAFGSLAVGFSALFVRPLVFFFFLRETRTFSFPELCLVFTLTQFVLALQFTPGSLGAYEGGMIGTFAILGVGEHLALAYVMCVRVADALLLLSGVLVAMHQGIKVLRMYRGPGGATRAAEELIASRGDPATASGDPLSPNQECASSGAHGAEENANSSSAAFSGGERAEPANVPVSHSPVADPDDPPAEGQGP